MCGKSILGFIAGASLGAIAGILIAPDRGSSTRKKLVEHTNDLRSMLNDWATDFIQILKEEGMETPKAGTAEAPEMNFNAM